MKFGYADPPYLGMGKKYAKLHEDALIWNEPKAHIELIDRLVEDYPDGWLICLSAPSLQLYLNHCPDDVRIGSWCKTFHQIRSNVAIQYSWEPVIWRGGRKETPVKPMVRDWHQGVIAMKRGLFGAKPKHFNDWVLDLLQFREGDELVDLFPGTGGMQDSINERIAVTQQQLKLT